MDRYLEEIEKEEHKIQLLEEKRKEIEDTNTKRRKKDQQYEKEGQSLHYKRKKYQRIKYYLDNEKSFRRQFLRKAISFGLKCGLGFIGITLVLSSLCIEPSTFPILKVLLSFPAISTMLGLVEYRNVSREFRKLLGNYSGNINHDLLEIEMNTTQLQNKKNKNQEAMQANQALLSEIDEAIIQLKENVNFYRRSRNDLIESLIENLNSYIGDFEPKEIDVHKVIEKKIQ